MKSRFRQTMLNSGVSVVTQFSSLILKFATQTFFIQILGAQFLGTQSFFTNLMLFLSCFEFGISGAFVYALYDPLAHQQTKQVAALINLFRYIYHRICILSVVVGLLFMAGLHFFHYDTELISNWQWAYLLVLANYLLFFLNEDKRQLLIADQLGYVSVINQGIILLVQTVFQVACLIWWPNYLVFLAIQLVCTLGGNLAVSWQIRHRYPYLHDKRYKTQRVAPAVLTKLKHNLKGLVSSKLSSIITTSKDGLLIGLLVSVHFGGLYANYTLIVSGITIMLTQVISSVTASVGNLTATTDAKNVKVVEDVLKTHYFVNFGSTMIAATCLMGLLNPFITLWVGTAYVLPQSTVILIVLIFACNQMRQTALIFITAYGLFFQLGIKALVETIVSIGLSVILVTQLKLGINGILLGTLVSQVGINLWWEPLIVYRDGLHLSSKNYWRRSLSYWMSIGVILTAIHYLPHQLLTNTWINLGALMLVLLIGSCAWLYLVHRRKNEFHQVKSLVKNLQYMIANVVSNR